MSALFSIIKYTSLLILAKFLTIPIVESKTSLLIAHTIKEKGVKEMEDRLEWHYKSPSDDDVYNFRLIGLSCG